MVTNCRYKITCSASFALARLTSNLPPLRLREERPVVLLSCQEVKFKCCLLLLILILAQSHLVNGSDNTRHILELGLYYIVIFSGLFCSTHVEDDQPF